MRTVLQENLGLDYYPMISYIENAVLWPSP